MNNSNYIPLIETLRLAPWGSSEGVFLLRP